jgi:two-component system, NarL family, nitrate/nitrite response regulator NarL
MVYGPFIVRAPFALSFLFSSRLSGETGVFARIVAAVGSRALGSGENTVSSQAKPVRIVIAGEHSIFRHGLRRLLEAESEFLIAGEAADGSEAAPLVRDLEPDVLLLGFSKSCQPAAEIMRDLVASGTDARTIVLTDRVDAPDVMCALQLGARGVVLKDSEPGVLFNSIQSVMAGHFWLGRERVSGALPGLRQLASERRRDKAFGLTPRELEIIRAVVAGHTNKEIADQSSISENTVKSHLTHIFNKLGASNRLELALFAAHHRLLDGV